MGTIDIVFGELKAIFKGVINIGLSCKMHYGINGLRQKKEVDKVITGNVALDELEIWGSSKG